LAAIVANKVSYRPIIIGILRVTNLIYTVAGHTPYQVGLCSFPSERGRGWHTI